MHMLLRLLLLIFLATAFAPVSAGRSVSGAELSMSRFSYPIAVPGRLPGDGFFVRHGYAVENTWYLPGYLHRRRLVRRGGRHRRCGGPGHRRR